MTNYKPSKEILEKYASVMINYACAGGKGIKKGDVVLLQVPECAKDFLVELRNAVLKSGGNPIIQYLPDDMSKAYFDLASDEQLSFFPDKYLKGIIDQIDHRVYVIADTDKYELKDVDPKKIMMRQKSFEQYRKWMDAKENEGKYSWTLCLYGTQAMADDVGLSLEAFWNEIITACYLNEENPAEKWLEIQNTINETKDKLTALDIDKLHVESLDNDKTNVFVGIGDKRQWLGGSGKNIPSFEVFISPHKDQTNGKIFFNEPLYSHGNLIKNITLEFKDGIIISAHAEEGEALLKEMIAMPGANKIGEYSLTDARLSKITQFMGNTLYDENKGGAQGNTHLAIGNAYKDSYTGDIASLTEKDWEDLGFNESVVHTDIISTERRRVTAHLKDGSTKVIYEDGKFLI